jgi:NAD(P)-dependent dehydrogenase (short-subunit alcohol dehydrogenase family)
MTTQRVLITAGASGIGLAIAKIFAADGARAHSCDIDTDAIAAMTTAFATITGTVYDVSDPADVDRLFADVKETRGGLDVLVNNAGISGPEKFWV